MTTVCTANEELLKQKFNIQTKLRGDDCSEYAIYVDCAKSLGWNIKTYDEWLNS